MNWFSCKHPFHRLGVLGEAVVKPIDADFESVTYRLICRHCGAEDLELAYARMIGGVDAFLERGRKQSGPLPSKQQKETTT